MNMYISTLVHTTRFGKILHQEPSNTNYWNALKKKSLEARKPKGLNWIAKID
jgi:hypothetical protein